MKGLKDVDGLVFHMGTKMVDGKLLTDGGRVMIIVAKEDTSWKNHMIQHMLKWQR